MHLQYGAALGFNSRLVDIKEVKDISWKTLGEATSGVDDSFGKKSHHRFARSTANETSRTTDRPYTSSTGLNSTIANGMTFSDARSSSMTPTSIPQNSTEISLHKYYNAKFVENSNFFKDLKTLYDPLTKLVIMKRLFSGRPNYINFVRQNLKFKFPFYGHDVDSVVVTSAGFLHIGPVVHSFMHDVHYVAPLMGDFFSNISNPVLVYIWSNENEFSVQWDSVIEGGTNQSKPFTFQVTLYANGTILFAYKHIPYSVEKFVRKDFPPKVGLADGFVITEYYTFIRFGRIVKLPIRTIYRYHTVSLEKKRIQSDSAFVLTPIPNCVQAKTCDDCFSDVISSNFQCKWCSKLQLCSDAFDWHRQNWTDSGCNKDAYSSETKCTSIEVKVRPRPIQGSKVATGIVVGVALAVIVFVCIIVLVYGYRNPTSKVGLFMIRYRPSKLFSRFK